MKIAKARIKRIEPTKTVGQNGFETRQLVVITDEQYPQVIGIQFQQNNVNDLDNFQEGDIVTIDINLRGREWTNKEGEPVVFNTVQGWKIVKE